MFLLTGTVMLLVSVSFLPVVLFSDIPTFFLLFLLPFFLVGVIFLAFVILLPFFEAKRLETWRYAVTDQRLLSLNSQYRFAYQIRELTGLNVKIYKDGRGTIYAQHKTIRGRTTRYLFEEIPDAERVFYLIERQRRSIYFMK